MYEDKIPDPPREFQPIRSELKLVSCDVCERAVLEAVWQAELMRSKVRDGRELEEERVHDMLDRLCSPDAPEGRWLTSLDFFSSEGVDLDAEQAVLGSGEVCRRHFRQSVDPTKGNFLLVREHHSPGFCERECETAAASCRALLDGEVDLMELGEALWAGDVANDAMARTVCLDWTRRCRSKRAPLPPPSGDGGKGGGQRKEGDFAFRPKSEEDAHLEQLKKSMRAQGMEGHVVNRQQIKDAAAERAAQAEAAAAVPGFMREEL